jgi:hypothetical protein
MTHRLSQRVPHQGTSSDTAAKEVRKLRRPRIGIERALVLCALTNLLLELGSPLPLSAQVQPDITAPGSPKEKPSSPPSTATNGTHEVLVPIETGSLAPLPLAQWDILGLQAKTKDLQDQLNNLQDKEKAEEAYVQTLAASLQNLQAQFSNHSHNVNHTVAGAACEELDSYVITLAGTGNGETGLYGLIDGPGGQQVTRSFYSTEACPGHPEWNGFHPNYTENLHVSTPVQGAQ